MSLRLDVPHLRAFLAVAETASFTRAAERLNLTQSAVSWQIKRLEERVGRPLFHRPASRAGDGVAPTAEGRDLLSHAARVLAAHDAAVDHLRRSDLAGRVRFGCSEDLIAERLAGLLARFRRGHPDVRLEIVVDTSTALRQRFERSDLDAALVQIPLGEGQPAGRALWRERPRWLVGPDSSLLVQRPLPLVTFGEACVYREAATRALAAVGVPWFPVLECPSLAGVQAAIRAGVGIGVLARRHLAEGLVEAPASAGLPPLPENLFALLADPAAAKPATLALTDLMRAELAESDAPGAASLEAAV